MITSIAGDLGGVAKGKRIAIAAARFNAAIVDMLVHGCVDVLSRHGIKDDHVTIVRCPGAWELPLVVRRLADSKNYAAVIALGCVIRGETPHFDYVAGECAKGLAKIQLDADLPVVFGVLTTDTVDQAQARAGLKAGNKGADAAVTAIEMLSLLERL